MVAPVAGATRSLSDFKDKDSFSSWAKDVITYLLDKGIMKGYNEKFASQRSLTRGEIAKVMAMSLGLVKPVERLANNVQTGFMM